MTLRQSLALYRALTSVLSNAPGYQSGLLKPKHRLTIDCYSSLYGPGVTSIRCSSHGTHDQAFTFQNAGVLNPLESSRDVRMPVLISPDLVVKSLLPQSTHHATPGLHLISLFSTLTENRRPAGTASGKDKTQAPDAGACDEALEDFQALKDRFDKLQRPASLRPWHQVVFDMAKTVGSGVVAVVRYSISIPQKVQDFRNMSKEDWQKWKSGAWATTKHEAHHYWVGTKLLWFDVKISSRLAMKAARGKELSRRERQQLARTTADLFRLVPMVVILVIPFLEFSLPFLLRIFPNMLPSTYEDKLKKEEELKRMLSVKLELARFLQDTVAEVAKDISRRKGSGSAKELTEFIKKVRSGEAVENADILRFAQLFNDELTLDNLERVQLVSMCQFVGIAPFGTDGFLRSRLRAQLQQIKQDDYAIEQEGLENLTDEELRVACRARGMRAPFGEGAVAYMRRQLHDWLDLSLHRGLPSSLLLLSRAFTITATVRDVARKKDLAYEKVKETLSVIPEEVVDKVSYEALGGENGDTSALEKKLEVLKREEALIREELARAEKTKKTASASAGKAATAQAPSDAGLDLATSGQKLRDAGAATETTDEASVDPISEEEKAQASAEEKQRRLNSALQALMDLASGGGVAKERTTFMELIKNETDRINSDLAMRAKAVGRNLVFSNRGMEVTNGLDGDSATPSPGATAPKEDSAPNFLANRVSKMLANIEKELDKVEQSIGGRMRILDTDNDGVISQQELLDAVRFLKEQLTPEELQQLVDLLSAKGEGTPGSILVSNLLSLAAKEQKLAAREQRKEAGGSDGGHKDVVEIHIK